MPTYTKASLSAAISGQQIQITGTSVSNRTTLHIPATGAYDEVWLYATNVDSTNRNLTIYWGATGLGNQMIASIQYQAGRVLIVDGKLLSGTSNTISASASTGNAINIDGFVNRIT